MENPLSAKERVAEALLWWPIPLVATAGAFLGGLVVWPLGLLCAVVLGGYQVASRSELAKREERIDAANTVISMLELVRRHVAGMTKLEIEEVRANVCRWSPSREGLQLVHHSGVYGSDEFQVVWRPSHGCVGHAWAEQQTQIYPDDGQDPVDASEARSHHRPWGMTPEQIRATGDCKSVVSVPIPHPRTTGSLIGVVSVDMLGTHVSYEAASEIATYVEELAGRVAQLVDKANVRLK